MQKSFQIFKNSGAGPFDLGLYIYITQYVIRIYMCNIHNKRKNPVILHLIKLDYD